MARDSGHTAATNAYDIQKSYGYLRWVSSATCGGKMMAWSGNQQRDNLYARHSCARPFRPPLLEEIFPYAPERYRYYQYRYKS
jgi:hypothetical protein